MSNKTRGGEETLRRHLRPTNPRRWNRSDSKTKRHRQRALGSEGRKSEAALGFALLLILPGSLCISCCYISSYVQRL
jgi:hypothetical protein